VRRGATPLLGPAPRLVGTVTIRKQRSGSHSTWGLAPYGTYMGDPPPGLSVRGAFFGRKSDKEVCGGVESVVSKCCSCGRPT
jgi:hypothetical protein